EGVGATAAALVDLSTVAGNKISNPPWVKFQSAGWVNFPSAPTTWSQQLPDWLGSHARCFAFLGGVPEIVVPDNLRSAVSKSHRY
ncbi:transposase, partial [Pseudomonas aeruginosa]|nr:transposase [Pseudomonas aeruginosa]